MDTLANQLKNYVNDWNRLRVLSIQIRRETSSRIGERSCNESKNRYCDIIPYDHSIVKLPSGAYINANVIKHGDITMILTQDPMRNTIGDYFEMITACNITHVVDLVGSEYFSCATDHDVKITDVNISDDIWIQNITVNEHRLTRLQYNKWDDCKVPEDMNAIERMIELIPTDALTVVNCSAGVGRSGTFFCAYIIANSIKQLAIPDILNIVLDVRKHRDECVQTIGQYKWLIEFAIKKTSIQI